MRNDISLSAVSAGFLAVLISYSGPLLIFFQAAQSAQISGEMLSSWVWAVSIGAAFTSIVLSWWMKVPVVTAWSAPGTALLVTLFPALSLNEAVGAYITAAIIMFLVGITGYFDRLVKSIPKGIAAGMMAGILFQFGAGAFASVSESPALAMWMIAAFIVLKRFFPRYNLILMLLVGIALSILFEGSDLSGVSLQLTTPSLILPEWSLNSTLSLAIPLVLVSLTGQFLPGMAILRGAGYNTPARPILTLTSLTSVALACFGGITIVIAAITAALCTGKESHEDPGKRYVAGISNGVFYLIGGTFSGTIILLFSAMPKTFIAVLAGLALISAISGNLAAAVDEIEHREAAIITFLATASGMTLFGLGAAFWGIVIGTTAYVVLNNPTLTKPGSWLSAIKSAGRPNGDH